jgi:protein-tyrosine phosphatase
VGGVIDLHSHILPGIDDGARTIAEARELARLALADGVEAIAATPHVRPDYPTTADEMEEGVAELRADFRQQGIPLQVLHGGEIDLWLLWQIPREDLARLTIAQTGRYLLLECPYRGWPFELNSAVSGLVEIDITPILAHPERNPAVQDQPDHVRGAVEAGALVQVTAGSLGAARNLAAQAAALRLLDMGLVHVLASDSHGPHIARRGLRYAAESLGDPDLARYLTVDVPRAIVAGDAIPERARSGSAPGPS